MRYICLLIGMIAWYAAIFYHCVVKDLDFAWFLFAMAAVNTLLFGLLEIAAAIEDLKSK